MSPLAWMWKPWVEFGTRPMMWALTITLPPASVKVTVPVTLLFEGMVVAALEGLIWATATFPAACIIECGAPLILVLSLVHPMRVSVPQAVKATRAAINRFMRPPGRWDGRSEYRAIVEVVAAQWQG